MQIQGEVKDQPALAVETSPTPRSADLRLCTFVQVAGLWLGMAEIKMGETGLHVGLESGATLRTLQAVTTAVCTLARSRGLMLGMLSSK